MADHFLFEFEFDPGPLGDLVSFILAFNSLACSAAATTPAALATAAPALDSLADGACGELIGDAVSEAGVLSCAAVRLLVTGDVLVDAA